MSNFQPSYDEIKQEIEEMKKEINPCGEVPLAEPKPDRSFVADYGYSHWADSDGPAYPRRKANIPKKPSAAERLKKARAVKTTGGSWVPEPSSSPEAMAEQAAEPLLYNDLADDSPKEWSVSIKGASKDYCGDPYQQLTASVERLDIRPGDRLLLQLTTLKKYSKEELDDIALRIREFAGVPVLVLPPPSIGNLTIIRDTPYDSEWNPDLD